MMLINVEIACRGDGQVESSMACDEIEHVVEKANASGNFRFAATVEREANMDIGLGSFAVNGGAATHTLLFHALRIPRKSVCISAGVPMVIRTNPGPMSRERSRSRIPWRSSLAKSAGPAGPKLARRKFPALGKVMMPRSWRAFAKDWRVSWRLRT